MKKAQGALEFLMTYGWAFLVILIMIGALAYFGVLDPSRFVPDKCVTSAGMVCNRYVANNEAGPNPTATIELKNNMGGPIVVYGAQVTSVDPSTLGRTAAAPTAAAAAAGTVEIAFDANGDGQLTVADATANADALERVVTVALPADADNIMADGETKTLLVKMAGGASLVEKRKMTMKMNFKYFPQDSSVTYAKDIPMDLVLTVQ